MWTLPSPRVITPNQSLNPWSIPKTYRVSATHLYPWKAEMNKNTELHISGSLSLSQSLPPCCLSSPDRPLLQKLSPRSGWNKCLPLLLLSLPHWFVQANLNPVSLGKKAAPLEWHPQPPPPLSLCLPFLLSYETVERANPRQSIHISGFLRRGLCHPSLSRSGSLSPSGPAWSIVFPRSSVAYGKLRRSAASHRSLKSDKSLNNAAV